MPLKHGKSKKTRSSNIRECVMSYKDKKTIGNIKPKSLSHAMKICQAIAYRATRESRK